MIVSIIVFIIIVSLDQISKALIFGTEARSIIGNMLWFQSEKNTGAAFSMLSGNNIFFIIFSSVLCVIFIYLLFSKKIFVSRLEKISIAIILGGAVSNLIDRILFTYVRDFIYLKFINFAVFNIADMAITVGAILLIISILFFQKKETKDGWIKFRTHCSRSRRED